MPKYKYVVGCEKVIEVKAASTDKAREKAKEKLQQKIEANGVKLENIKLIR